MTVKIYVDGSGGPGSAYGYYAESGRTFYEKSPGLTNTQAEYMAIISALREFAAEGGDEIVIHSDSKVVVSQLNHESAINKDRLRELAMQAWDLIGRHGNVTLQWIPRGENPAGKMLGS